MYQFVHVNAYAQKVSVKTKERKEGDDKPRSVQDIINETLRVEGFYSPLITNPQPPIHLYGEPVEQIPEIVADWAKQTKDPKGRKTRADAKGLLAGVFSVKEGTPPEVWEQVKADGIAWAKAKYGERLKCVVEHIDEEHPHCHFFVVPLPGEAFETVHEGIAAKKAALSEGVPTKQANVEYRNAMKGFCDGYYEEVGAPNGMLRLGPGRRRLPRVAYFAEIQQAQAMKDQFRRVAELKQNAEIEAEIKILGAEAVIETANSEAKTITESAVSVAKTTIESAASEAKTIISEAKSESAGIVSKTKATASEYLSKAENKGYEDGIKKAEEEMKGSWLYSKIESLFKRRLKRLEDENAEVKKERDALKEEIEPILSFKDMFFEKAMELTSAMKRIAGLESALEQAEKKAALADKQKSEIDKLSNQLIKVQDRNKNLEAVVESLTPEDEKKQGKWRTRELDETGYIH